ncbi:unnamed protein product [Gordionus sp. m RMFG-2023]
MGRSRSCGWNCGSNSRAGGCDSQPDSDVELVRTGNHLEARDGTEDERSNEEGVEESTIQESLNVEEDREGGEKVERI